jgi:RNA polymerase sigma factor (sigma-70 family)
MTTTELYSRYHKTIFNLAWKANARCPSLEIDDFVSEGNIIFLKCINRYDNNKSACFHTYLYSSVKNFFRGMIQKQATQEAKLGPSFNGIDPERQALVMDTLSKMSVDAQEVVELILESPKEFIKAIPHITKTSIREFLRTIWDGDLIQYRITDAFAEITETLKTL